MKTRLLIIIMLFYACGVRNADAQTQMWGTTQHGGVNGDGVIFSMDGNGTNYQVAYSFTNATGSFPLGNVVLANNGKLYGVTLYGGWNDSCVIYTYDPCTGTYTNIYDFAQFSQFGYNAQSGMIKAATGILYGLCSFGGPDDAGVIYKVDPATDTHTDIYDFDGTNGAAPFGSLVELSNGKLYGVTNSGGAGNGGVIFSFDPFTSVFVKLHDFDQATGYQPYFGRLLQATNSKLYGMTYSGGANYMGVIFSFDIATGIYTDLHDFDGVHGRIPHGGLIQASNGLLYGMTSAGGATNDGVLFNFDITTNIFTDLLDFDNVSTGANPARSLSQASNGKLYGTTMFGGANNAGVAFSFDITSNVYTKLVDFNYGLNPDCDLVETPILTCTGIPVVNTASDATVYPNPATSSLTVTGSDKDDAVQFIDVAGKDLLLLKTSARSKTDVDISHFPNVFFIKRQNREIIKIVKE